MKHQEESHDGIQEAVRRALTEELPKALESALSRLSDQTDTQTKQPELLSRNQAAKILGVSLQTVAAMISDGTLESVRIRRRVLVPYRSIHHCLDRKPSTKANGGQQ